MCPAVASLLDPADFRSDKETPRRALSSRTRPSRLARSRAAGSLERIASQQPLFNMIRGADFAVHTQLCSCTNLNELNEFLSGLRCIDRHEILEGRCIERIISRCVYFPVTITSADDVSKVGDISSNTGSVCARTLLKPSQINEMAQHFQSGSWRIELHDIRASFPGEILS